MAVKGKKQKLDLRSRKKIGIRKRIHGTDERPRLSVFRSARHTYAQVVSDESGKTLAAASTLDPEVLGELEKIVQQVEEKKAEKAAKGKGKEDSRPQKTAPAAKSRKSVLAATAVGVVVARRSAAKNVSSVVFDRNGFIYHGRVQAVADGARKGGLRF